MIHTIKKLPLGRKAAGQPSIDPFSYSDPIKNPVRSDHMCFLFVYIPHSPALSQHYRTQRSYVPAIPSAHMHPPDTLA